MQISSHNDNKCDSSALDSSDGNSDSEKGIFPRAAHLQQSLVPCVSMFSGYR